MLTATDLERIRVIVRAELAAHQPAAPALDVGLVLRAIVSTRGSAEFCVRDLLAVPDLRILLAGRSAKSVGRLLVAALDRPHGGLVLRDYLDGERGRNGRLYSVERVP